MIVDIKARDKGERNVMSEWVLVPPFEDQNHCIRPSMVRSYHCHHGAWASLLSSTYTRIHDNYASSSSSPVLPLFMNELPSRREWVQCFPPQHQCWQSWPCNVESEWMLTDNHGGLPVCLHIKEYSVIDNGNACMSIVVHTTITANTRPNSLTGRDTRLINHSP